MELDDNDRDKRKNTTPTTGNGSGVDKVGRKVRKKPGMSKAQKKAVWYDQFKKGGRKMVRKYKLVILSIYLLIVLGALVLHPFMIVMLTNGFHPIIRQPYFAYAYRWYVDILKHLALHPVQGEMARNINDIFEVFREVLARNDRVLYFTLYSTPINLYLTLCLAFRSTRRNVELLMPIAHFISGIVNGGLVASLLLSGWETKHKKGMATSILQIIKELGDNSTHTDTAINRIEEFPEYLPCLLPACGILSVIAFLHISLSIFFVLRDLGSSFNKTGKQSRFK